ncbi:MAG: glycoside hydrolase family 26 protein, partial [Melioribacteraceae bacterium]|nr:glycoside hydrolase family 26 protein [Melioribacteraceae bacterium]
MKKVLMILIICSSFSYAQTTGFLQDFNDGTMTGWATGHDNTFQLSVDSTFLRIDYSRNASSDLWDNFNLTLPKTIDVSNNPRLYVRAKSNVPVVIGLKPVPVNDVAIISQSILGDGKWKELFFEITNTTNQNISTIYAYLDAGTTEQKSGTVWFDEIRIGDSLLTLPANFTELEEAIKSANALLLNSAEGTGEGQFPSGSKSVLENEINSFLDLLKLDIPQSSVDSAITELYDVCSTFESNVISLPLNIVDEKANKQTKYLFLNLQENMERSILFGMHDVTGYGVGWSGDDDRSDVKSIVGDYPAIYSEDLNNITRNQQVDRIRYRLTSAYGRGGIITMCWHQYDPDGRSFYADDIGNEKIVSQILPGGNRHQDYLDKLKRIANFFKSLRGEKGEAIPVIFRPYHEHTGGWFWWGVGHCTTEEY